jgi:hypothetical protein
MLQRSARVKSLWIMESIRIFSVGSEIFWMGFDTGPLSGYPALS